MKFLSFQRHTQSKLQKLFRGGGGNVAGSNTQNRFLFLLILSNPFGGQSVSRKFNRRRLSYNWLVRRNLSTVCIYIFIYISHPAFHTCIAIFCTGSFQKSEVFNFMLIFLYLHNFRHSDLYGDCTHTLIMGHTGSVSLFIGLQFEHLIID